jgi:hypothetical protein
VKTRKHWSDSQTGLMERCGIAYERRYVNGERMPSSLPQLRGRVVHEGARITLRSKVETGEPVATEDLVERVDQAYRDGIRKGVQYRPKDEEVGVEKARDDERQIAHELTRLHAEKVAPLIDPELTEERVVLGKSESLPIDLVMVLDVVEKDGSIRDLKTAAKKPDDSVAALSRQLGTYQLGRLAQGAPPPYLKIDTLVRRDSGSTDSYLAIAKPFDSSELTDLVRRHRRAYDTAQAGAFMHASDMSWWCSRNACEYADTCPFVADRRKHATIVDLKGETDE